MLDAHQIMWLQNFNFDFHSEYYAIILNANILNGAHSPAASIAPLSELESIGYLFQILLFFPQQFLRLNISWAIRFVMQCIHNPNYCYYYYSPKMISNHQQPVTSRRRAISEENETEQIQNECAEKEKDH